MELHIVVVGGGKVAERRVEHLLSAGAEITIVSPELSARLTELHSDGLVRWQPREYQAGDLAGSWLVQAATSSSAVNDLVAEHAKQARIFCFKGGDPAGATAWRPAVAQLDDITISVNASGDPHRAKATRDRIVQFLSNEKPQVD